MASALSPTHREESMTRMQCECFDIVVVGGGVTGAGSALDAASRGLDVALIEAQDYASGASSKSSKLIHGGLRYLEMLDFRLVHQALKERGLLLRRLAPHLVRPVEFLWPLTHRLWERPYMGAGMLLYDTMGGRPAVPRARHLTRRQTLRLAPDLRASQVVGGITFYDAQEDDARLVMFLARTAAEYGAALATQLRMEELVYESGRVAGVSVRCGLTGARFTVRGKHVILAAGAGTNAALRRDGEVDSAIRVRPSKGVHIVVPRTRIQMETALLTRTERSLLFILPWGEHWIVGDTDTDWQYDSESPVATRRDIEYLLAKANRILQSHLEVDDVESVFAGLRPLVAQGDTIDTPRLSRDHTIDRSEDGLTVIAGGKYTTYRVMAADAVDSALRDRRDRVVSSCTSTIPLVGARGYRERWAARGRLARTNCLDVPGVERLLRRYGSCVDDLLEMMQRDQQLRRPLRDAPGYLAAEVVYACTNEGAVHLDDVLCRRTRIGMEYRDRGLGCCEEVALLMGSTLGWSGQRRKEEVERFRRLVAAQTAAEAVEEEPLAYAGYLETVGNDSAPLGVPVGQRPRRSPSDAAIDPT